MAGLGAGFTLEMVVSRYNLNMTVLDDGVRVIDCGQVEVDTDQDVDTQLAARSLVRYNERVTTQILPFQKKGKIMVPLKVVVIMSGYTKSSVVVTTIKQVAKREGNMLELLALYQLYPLLAKVLYLVALGSPLPDHRGSPLVPVLDSGGGEDGVRLDDYESGWYHDTSGFVAAGSIPSVSQG